MKTSIAKWGNSQGVRLNAELMKLSGLQIGDDVEIKYEDSNFVIYPQKKKSLYLKGVKILHRRKSMDRSSGG